jgi:hypothetical protein
MVVGSRMSGGTRTIGIAGVLALALMVVQVALAEVPVSRFTAADQASAKAAVVRLTDFRAGAGWKGGLVKNAKAFTGSPCPGLYDPKQSDLVITGVAIADFTAAGAHLTSGAQVYKTEKMAKLDWDRTVLLPASFACQKKQAVADSSAEFRFVSMKRMPFPRVGGSGVAVRWRTIVDYTPKGAKKPVRVLIDDVAFGRRRTGIAFTLTMPYRDRAAADTAEPDIARTLDHRIRT